MGVETASVASGEEISSPSGKKQNKEKHGATFLLYASQVGNSEMRTFLSLKDVGIPTNI